MNSKPTASRLRGPVDPIAQFHRWFDAARKAGEPIPEAMALATAGRDGRPSVRFVLLKQADDHGFVFFGDERSRKGRDLRHSPRAAMVFYWDRTGKQVRVEGRVEKVSAAEADAYWATRPRESRLAATASVQSAVLGSREQLVAAVKRLRKLLRGKDIPRPATWTGFRVTPESIEFWTRRHHRLHERDLFELRGRQWRRQILNP